MLKGAGREKKVRKIKVKEEDLAGYKASYEVSLVKVVEKRGDADGVYRRLL